MSKQSGPSSEKSDPGPYFLHLSSKSCITVKNCRSWPFKVVFSCPIEIIKRAVSVSHWIKGALRGALPVYITISFTRININTLPENT